MSCACFMEIYFTWGAIHEFVNVSARNFMQISIVIDELYEHLIIYKTLEKCEIHF